MIGWARPKECSRFFICVTKKHRLLAPFEPKVLGEGFDPKSQLKETDIYQKCVVNTDSEFLYDQRARGRFNFLVIFKYILYYTVIITH